MRCNFSQVCPEDECAQGWIFPCQMSPSDGGGGADGSFWLAQCRDDLSPLLENKKGWITKGAPPLSPVRQEIVRKMNNSGSNHPRRGVNECEPLGESSKTRWHLEAKAVFASVRFCECFYNNGTFGELFSIQPATALDLALLPWAWLSLDPEVLGFRSRLTRKNSSQTHVCRPEAVWNISDIHVIEIQFRWWLQRIQPLYSCPDVWNVFALVTTPGLKG